PVAVEVAALMALVLLVAARAEGHVALAGEQHAADGRVVADPGERVDELAHGLRAERVADLGPRDRHLRDARAGVLVADVVVRDDGGPGDRGGHAASSCRKSRGRRRKVAGRSSCGVWPAPSTIASRAPGIPAATNWARGRARSPRAPAMTRVGFPTSPRRSTRGSIAPWPAPRRLAASSPGRLASRIARILAARAAGREARVAEIRRGRAL